MRLQTLIIALSLALGLAKPLLAQAQFVEIDLRIGTYKAGYSRGQETAKRHLKDGKLRLITFGGLSAPSPEGFDSALSALYAEHGIELSMAGACTSPEDERGYIAGYNSVTVAELERRFGKNFIARMLNEADALAKRAPSKRWCSSTLRCIRPEPATRTWSAELKRYASQSAR